MRCWASAISRSNGVERWSTTTPVVPPDVLLHRIGRRQPPRAEAAAVLVAGRRLRRGVGGVRTEVDGPEDRRRAVLGTLGRLASAEPGPPLAGPGDAHPGTAAAQ